MKKTTEQFTKEVFKFVTENGLENTSIRDICDDTGMSTGSLYYRFKSKEGVITIVGEYGLNKVADEIFSYAISTILEQEKFFDLFLGFVKTKQPELRAVYQIVTSPLYGDLVRKAIKIQYARYDKYVERLANVLRASKEELTPILHLFISAIFDYAVWDNYKTAKMQMDILGELLSNTINKSMSGAVKQLPERRN